MVTPKMNILILILRLGFYEGSLTMAVTAPIPPTKPIPPSPPTMAPTVSVSSSDSHPASSPSSLHQEKTETVKKMGDIQENKQSPSTEKSSSSTTPKESPSTNPTPPLASFDTRDGISANTTVSPAHYPTPDKNTSSTLGYISFLAILVVLIGVVIGLRLWKHRSNQSRTLIDCSEKTIITNDENGINVIASSQTKAAKVKNHFEIRI